MCHTLQNTNVQIVDVNFKTEEDKNNAHDISLEFLGCHHIVKFRASKC